ncbi:ROK family transcriptional regulator [Clostridium estertheticum]|uniref:ROK family transcriptional regulator n=1 Tax=Clostridium estertheticum TaxID=238834 RepID=UPI0013E93FDE|nr:ROK family transcriptional regulator [Clostridium estertheticum]MBZ9686496.1 ROK family transcriptional regulator [Clostridium estertheticum]
MIKILEGLSCRDLEILNIIQKRGPITKKNLHIVANIKLTTLNRIMKTLKDKKVIVEYGESKSTGGRKAVEYDVSQADFYAIGIDISRTYVKLILTNMKLSVLKKEEFIMDESYSPEKTVEKIILTIEQMLSDLNIKKDEVLGIGLGTVGPIDREKGIILNPKSFFNSNWVNVPIKAMLEERLKIPCFIDNGANTAVLGEYLYGKGKKIKSIAYIHCGIGLRSAIIRDGIIIRSMNDREDAFAHMIVELNGEECYCGNCGCIESYSSIDSILKKINSKTKYNNKLINEKNYSEKLKVELQNNDIAIEVVNHSAEILGIGLSNLVRLLNPELVILSGPLIMNFENYYEKSIESFRNINHRDNRVMFSKGGKFEEDIIAIGAAAMVMEGYLKSI